jgi:hypothetical protein
VMGRDGHTVRHLIDDVQLLDGNLIDLIQHVDTGDVNSTEEETQGICLELLTKLRT